MIINVWNFVKETISMKSCHYQEFLKQLNKFNQKICIVNGKIRKMLKIHIYFCDFYSEQYDKILQVSTVTIVNFLMKLTFFCNLFIHT